MSLLLRAFSLANMHAMRSRQCIAALAAAIAQLIATGCSSKSPTATEVAGEYVFASKTKVVEVLSIAPDFTFRQEFYRDRSGYIVRTNMLYMNDGFWTNRGSALVFTNWLQVFDYPNADILLTNPMRFRTITHHWERPGSKDRRPLIMISEEFRYALFWVPSRSDGERVLKSLER